jgi:hypothetical protein
MGWAQAAAHGIGNCGLVFSNPVQGVVSWAFCLSRARDIVHGAQAGAGPCLWSASMSYSTYQSNRDLEEKEAVLRLVAKRTTLVSIFQIERSV